MREKIAMSTLCDPFRVQYRVRSDKVPEKISNSMLCLVCLRSFDRWPRKNEFDELITHDCLRYYLHDMQVDECKS